MTKPRAMSPGHFCVRRLPGRRRNHCPFSKLDNAGRCARTGCVMSIEEARISIPGSGRALAFAKPELLRAPPDFLELLPLAIYACDADGRILWFNSRASELWGRRPAIGDP